MSPEETECIPSSLDKLEPSNFGQIQNLISNVRFKSVWIADRDSLYPVNPDRHRHGQE